MDPKVPRECRQLARTHRSALPLGFGINLAGSHHVSRCCTRYPSDTEEEEDEEEEVTTTTLSSRWRACLRLACGLPALSWPTPVLTLGPPTLSFGTRRFHPAKNCCVIPTRPARASSGATVMSREPVRRNPRHGNKSSTRVPTAGKSSQSLPHHPPRASTGLHCFPSTCVGLSHAAI
jgi:hypothetical protein